MSNGNIDKGASGEGASLKETGPTTACSILFDGQEAVMNSSKVSHVTQHLSNNSGLCLEIQKPAH